MNKKVWIQIISVIYLIFEIAYRSLLVEELSKPSHNPILFEVIENVGRLISSLGLTLLLTELVFKCFHSWWSRALVFVFIFAFLNQLLKTAIQSAIEALPTQHKLEMYYGYTYRDFMYKNYGARFSRVHLLTIPLSGLEFEMNANKHASFKKMVAQSHTKDSKEYRAFLESFVKDGWIVFEPLWLKYKQMQMALEERAEGRDAERRVRHIGFELNNKARDLFYNYRVKILSMLYTKKLRNIRDYEKRFYQAREIVTPTYDKFGLAKETMTRKNRAYYLLKRGTHRYGSIRQWHYYEPVKERSYKRFKKLEAINREYGFKEDKYDYADFIETPYLKEKLNAAIKRKTGFDYPLKTFNKEELSAFYKAKVQYEINQELISLLKAAGIDCEISLYKKPFEYKSYYRFVQAPCFSDFFKENAPYLFKDNGRLINVNSKSSIREAMRNLNSKLKEDRVDRASKILSGNFTEEDLNFFAKGVYIPLAVVFLANLAIFGNLIKLGLSLVPSLKYRNHIAWSVFFIIALAPFLLANPPVHKGSKEEIKLFTQSRPFITNWFEGMEVALEKVDFIARVVRPGLIHLQLIYIDMAKPSEDRSKERYWTYHANTLKARLQRG